MRADLLLVERGLAPSRARARELIEAGAVLLHGPAGRSPVVRASAPLDADATLTVDDAARLRYVSRGGVKLGGALSMTGIAVAGRVCLDVGQSTGGFTDCLLQAGAARVVGIDVGHGQLHASLRGDPRIDSFEGVNVRHLTGMRSSTGEAREARVSGLAASIPRDGFALAVIDLSFISLAHALPAVSSLLRPDGELLALVKPQFEVGPGGVDARGLVRDPGRYPVIRLEIERVACETGLLPMAWFESPIRGGDGNREFFMHARRRSDRSSDL